MPDTQHTLAKAVHFEGHGLHTAVPSKLSIEPAPAGHGLVFSRPDLEGAPLIPAHVDYVTDLSRSTTIGIGEASIQTVEHVLSALVGLGIDNALIKVEGAETPALDGSAAPYAQAILKAGLKNLGEPREYLELKEPVYFSDPSRGVDLAAFPSDTFELNVTVDFNSELMGLQSARWADGQDYVAQIAPNRTFCFFHELSTLIEHDLIKGGNLNNALVLVEHQPGEQEVNKVNDFFGWNISVKTIDKGKLLNGQQFHFANEPARHKLLDLMGDLALVGGPLKARIVASRPGHAANVGLGKAIVSQLRQQGVQLKYNQNLDQGFALDIKAIQEILPHRFPFLLVDRVLKLEKNRIEAIKNVSMNEPFFQGHFPGNPIMPGVLQIEALAQAGGVMLMNLVDEPQDHWIYFVAIENARFKRPVGPGDQMHFVVELLSFKRNICKISGRATVNGQLVMEADMMASVTPKNR